MSTKFESEDGERSEREWRLVPRPAVKGLKAPYEPEIMCGNAQWSVGVPCATREEAKQVARKAADEMLQWLLLTANHRASTMYKLAKP